MIITVDGPTASGKSTIARLLASKLGYYYLASGLLYRALAYLLITKKHYSMNQLYHPKASDLAEVLNSQRFQYNYDNQLHEQIYFDEKSITQFLKDAAIDQAASIVSTDPEARFAINALAHTIASNQNSIVDGRDAGSVIFPHADLKFFLTAKPEVRALRWIEAQKKLGKTFSKEEAMDLIAERDKRDSERKVAPLIVPKHAISIDNSDLNSEQTLNLILSYIK